MIALGTTTQLKACIPTRKPFLRLIDFKIEYKADLPVQKNSIKLWDLYLFFINSFNPDSFLIIK